MKYLEEFYNYINESDSYSDEELEELLVPIKDLGVSCDVGDKTTITEGKYSGNEYRSVRFNFPEFEKTKGLGYVDGVFCGDKIWDFFDELISLRNRLENDKIFLHFFNSRYGSHGVIIMFVTGTVENDSSFEMEKIYNVLRTKYNKGTTDFYYSMIMRLDKEEPCIKIKVGSYTRRKLTYFLRGVDTSNLNIDVKISGKSFSYGGDEAIIKITLKE